MSRGVTLGAIVASVLVALVGFVVLVLAYPPNALDFGLDPGCRKARNGLGIPVAVVCDDAQGGTTTPVSGAATEQYNPSTGIQIR
jgi:hypothetical protein